MTIAEDNDRVFNWGVIQVILDIGLLKLLD